MARPVKKTPEQWKREILNAAQQLFRLPVLLSCLGFFMIPAGAAFLLPWNPVMIYCISVLCFCGIQIAVSIFSVFAVSYIQQKTPNHLIGKIMAYTSAITLCVQPIGQIVYGFLFDRFSDAVYLVLLPSGLIVYAVGLCARSLFRKL